MPRKRVLIVDCLPPGVTEQFENEGLPDMFWSFEAELLTSLDPTLQHSVVYPARLEEDLPDRGALAQYDGMLWTGTSYSVFEDVPEVNRQISLMQEGFAAGIPIFGICGGLQVAVVAAGGSVVPNPKGLETPLARDIEPTGAGATHPLLRYREGSFDAYCNHFDIVHEIPEGAELLASNAHSPVQALAMQVGECEFWGVQYHPDFSRKVAATLPSWHTIDWIAAGVVKDEPELALVRRGLDGSGTPEEVAAATRILALTQDVLDPGCRRAEVRAWLETQLGCRIATPERTA